MSFLRCSREGSQRDKALCWAGYQDGMGTEGLCSAPAEHQRGNTTPKGTGHSDAGESGEGTAGCLLKEYRHSESFQRVEFELVG